MVGSEKEKHVWKKDQGTRGTGKIIEDVPQWEERKMKKCRQMTIVGKEERKNIEERSWVEERKINTVNMKHYQGGKKGRGRIKKITRVGRKEDIIYKNARVERE